jgi:hypothetical protein
MFSEKMLNILNLELDFNPSRPTVKVTSHMQRMLFI